MHSLRRALLQAGCGDIGAAPGIGKQASRLRQTTFEQVLKVVMARSRGRPPGAVPP